MLRSRTDSRNETLQVSIYYAYERALPVMKFLNRDQILTILVAQ